MWTSFKALWLHRFMNFIFKIIWFSYYYKLDESSTQQHYKPSKAFIEKNIFTHFILSWNHSQSNQTRFDNIGEKCGNTVKTCVEYFSKIEQFWLNIFGFESLLKHIEFQKCNCLINEWFVILLFGCTSKNFIFFVIILSVLSLSQTFINFSNYIKVIQ